MADHATPQPRPNSPKSLYSHQHVQHQTNQKDSLYITHFGNSNAVLNAVTYDKNNALSAPRTFVLNGDQQRLEIELLLDGNECVDSKTEITMTMHTTLPMLNCLANMGTSVAVCPDPYTAGCACTV